eukprot:jgi/Mesvir1/23586/Mv18277-RA.1
MASQEVQTELIADGKIAVVTLNRPQKANSISETLWEQIPTVFRELDDRGTIRAIILCGAGAHFCAGIELSNLDAMKSTWGDDACPGRRRFNFRRHIKKLQAAFTALEECKVPVIAAVHGCCFGAGLDLITACDLRYCTEDAQFCVKEVDLAITADIGTLQRLPGIVGHGVARELALTARVFSGAQANAMGLVTEAFPSREQLLAKAKETAILIAAKSPLAVAGTKAVLLHARDHPSVAEGLDYVATWNSAVLFSSDLDEGLAAAASRGKRPPRFNAKL